MLGAGDAAGGVQRPQSIGEGLVTDAHHDTAHFAVNAIRTWWNRMGRGAYGGTDHLVITADAGGSNSPRTRLWKWELQRFANRTGLSITVCHAGHQQMEPHRAPAALLHRHELARQAAGQPGYRGQSDRRHDHMQRINLSRHEFRGDWNYTIEPKSVS